ncbi:hypothetical protein [Anabaena azotica]|nr:hypothetical protein [Anabaena azotica]
MSTRRHGAIALRSVELLKAISMTWLAPTLKPGRSIVAQSEAVPF